MYRPIVIILIIALISWILGVGFCHNSTCPECQTARAVLTPPADNSALSININDDDLNFTAAASDNLLFTNGSCEYMTPLTDKLQTVFQNTVQHLQSNTKRILVLTGLYEDGETNDCTDSSDLGIARAENVKQLLIEMGAPEDRIELEGSEIRDLAEHKNMLVGGVDYYFKESIEPIMDEVALRTEKITLYFATNKKEINLDTDQRNYMEGLKAYLAQNPDAKAKVTGYTDDRGEDKTNIRLSRKRSEFVRDFMIEQGISKRQIKNKGMGPDDPVASNDTEEGRALNRRVEITLE